MPSASGSPRIPGVCRYARRPVHDFARYRLKIARAGRFMLSSRLQHRAPLSQFINETSVSSRRWTKAVAPLRQRRRSSPELAAAPGDSAPPDAGAITPVKMTTMARCLPPGAPDGEALRISTRQDAGVRPPRPRYSSVAVLDFEIRNDRRSCDRRYGRWSRDGTDCQAMQFPAPGTASRTGMPDTKPGSGDVLPSYIGRSRAAVDFCPSRRRRLRRQSSAVAAPGEDGMPLRRQRTSQAALPRRFLTPRRQHGESSL